ncbi:MAG: class I SAM-dependent methyltransferase [Acidobacteriota bacterium]
MTPASPLPDPKTRKARQVSRMFGTIAPTYDLLNHLLSMNMDRLWRRKAVKSLSPRDGGAYLDICTGTGDLALAVLARVKCRMLGMDFSRPMLDIARGKAEKRGRRLTLCEADALHLPIADASIDGAMVAFGVRNFEDLTRVWAKFTGF